MCPTSLSSLGEQPPTCPLQWALQMPNEGTALLFCSSFLAFALCDGYFSGSIPRGYGAQTCDLTGILMLLCRHFFFPSVINMYCQQTLGEIHDSP